MAEGRGRCVTVTVVLVVIVGIILIVVGGCLIPVFNRKFSNDLKRHVIPNGANSDSYNAWLNMSRYKPVYRYFYFFDITNPEKPAGKKPNVTVNQTGPYVYRVEFRRREASFVENGSRIQYELYKTYTFEKNLSTGSEDDVITTVNLPILNLAMRMRFEGRKIKTRLAQEVKRLGEKLFVNVTVFDLLWGYENKNLKNLLKFIDGYSGLKPLNDTVYGLFYQQQQPNRTTYEKTFEIAVDKDDIASLWKVKKWNDLEKLTAWNTPGCNTINGTDGYAWPPLTYTSQTRHIFDSEWCRSIRMSNKGETKWIDGLKTDVFFYDNKTFTYKGENQGFCQKTPNGRQQCLEAGVFNITKCRDNIPLVLSQPHFFGAQKKYRDAIIGIREDKSLHTTTFNIETYSGEVVEAARKMQLNAYVMHLSSFPDTTKFNKCDTVVPIVWMNEVYSLNEKERNYIRNNFYGNRLKFDAVQYFLIVLGALLIIVGAVIAFVWYCRRQTPQQEGERQPLLH